MHAGSSLPRTLFAALLTSCVSLAVACGPADGPDSLEFTGDTELGTSKVPGSSLRRFITDHPFGCLDDPPKPWVARSLFHYDKVPTPPGLRRYCLYKYGAKNDPLPHEVTQLKDYVYHELGVSIVEDTVVTGPLGLDQDLRAVNHDTLLAHAGALEGPWPKGLSPRSRIRLAFPDSSPEEKSGTIPDGRMDHGSILAWLARDLSAPALSFQKTYALTHVTTGIALPQVDNDVEDIMHGGYFGTRGQLAEAVYRVTAGWLLDADDPSTRQERLVVNLSVGWEPEPGCATATDKKDFELPTRAAFDAVSYVSCLGGLVVAAAGNDPGHTKGGEPTAAGPTCPAAWSATFEAPAYNTCRQLLGDKYQGMLPIPSARIPATHPPAPGLDNPLLYAVGGLDFARHPIAASRQGAFPKYAAIASGASAAPPGSDLPAPLTGTSVSTAVASSIAAVTWTYRPELTAPEVMDLVYQAGQPVGWNADFGIAGPEPVHSLALCSSIQRACDPHAGIVPPRCPAEPVKCPAVPRESGPNPPLTTTHEHDLKLFFENTTRHELKSDDVNKLVDFSPPSDRFQNAAVPPWVYPQPLITPCSLCLFDVNRVRDVINPVLYVSLDPAFTQTIELSEATLVLRVGSNFWASYTTTLGPLGSSVARRGESFVVDFGTISMDRVWSAHISWRSHDTSLGTTASIHDSVLVTQ